MAAKDLVIKIGVDLAKNVTKNLETFKKNVQATFSHASKSAQGLASELSNVEQALSTINKIQVFKQQKREVEQAKQAWKEAEQKVRALANEIKESGGTTKKLSKDFEQTKKSPSRGCRHHRPDRGNSCIGKLFSVFQGSSYCLLD